MGEVLVEIRDVVKVFGAGADAARALAGVSLAVRENEFFTLLGPSGCGKTTLLRIVAGFEFPDSGSVLLDGVDIARHPPDKRPVNTVFQNYALFPHLTVLQNVAFGLEMRGIAAAAAAEKARATLDLVMLRGFENRRPAQLSGGQQQRVALARALANRPRVLLLDEPLSALDYKLRKAMRAELKRLRKETGVTFIFVTHDQEEALAMSDRVAVMSEGRVRQIDSPAEVYENPADRFVADFIGEINFLRAEIVGREDGLALARLPGGETIKARAPTDVPPGGALFAVRPERVALSPIADGGGIAGRIDDVVYQGDATRYEVSTAACEAALIAIETNDGGAKGRFAPGDAVRITAAPEAVRWLRE